MTVALEDLRDEIRREELSAGLSTERPLTRADIERRRRQIAQVGLLVFFGVVVSTLRANVWGAAHDSLIDPNLLRAATITAAGGFIAYVVEKERHLRRLVFLEGEERSVQLAIADRLLEAAPSPTRRARCTGSLVLERVLQRTLDRVRDLVGAEIGVDPTACRPTASCASRRCTVLRRRRCCSAEWRWRRVSGSHASRCCCRASTGVTTRRPVW